MSMKPADISGLMGVRYGNLLVISDGGSHPKGRKVNCKCDCGKDIKVFVASLKSGDTKSCGCFRVKVHTKHGFSKHPLAKVWFSIRSRCYNENDCSYSNYGGRGVRMCDEWENNMECFIKWCLSNGWEKGLDVDKDIKSSQRVGDLYSPELCTITTRKNNLRSKRDNHIIEFNGESKCISEWVEKLNMSRRTIDSRIKNGWPIEKVLTPYKRAK